MSCINGNVVVYAQGERSLPKHAKRSRSVDVSLVWWPRKQQHTDFWNIDTGIHTDNGQQVAIDYNINFISNRHDLQCFELLGSGDRTLTLKASRSQHFQSQKSISVIAYCRRLRAVPVLLENS